MHSRAVHRMGTPFQSAHFLAFLPQRIEADASQELIELVIW